MEKGKCCWRGAPAGLRVPVRVPSGCDQVRGPVCCGAEEEGDRSGQGWGDRQGRSRGCFQHGRWEANGVFSLALLSFLLTSGGGPLLGTGGRSWLGALALPHLPSRGCHEREFKFQSRAEPPRTMALASAGGTFDLSGWLALQRHLSCLTSLLRCYLNNVLPCATLWSAGPLRSFCFHKQS